MHIGFLMRLWSLMKFIDNLSYFSGYLSWIIQKTGFRGSLNIFCLLSTRYLAIFSVIFAPPIIFPTPNESQHWCIFAVVSPRDAKFKFVWGALPPDFPISDSDRQNSPAPAGPGTGHIFSVPVPVPAPGKMARFRFRRFLFHNTG